MVIKTNLKSFYRFLIHFLINSVPSLCSSALPDSGIIIPGSGDPDSSILFYRMRSLDPGIMMPESGRALEHKEGTELIRKWIKNL